MFFLLIPPAFCHAQTPTWYAGQTASFSFQGVFPPTFNLAEESLLAANGDPVPVTNETYTVSGSFEVDFTITIGPNAPTEMATFTFQSWCDDYQHDCIDGGGVLWQYSFPVQIVGCPTPAIASVLPSTWFAGKSYDKVVIKGTNFITSDKATAACPVTPVTITAADGSAVPISAVTVENKTTITLTGVAPPAADPTETATVTAGTAPNTATSATLATPPQILGNEIHCDPSMNCSQPVISTTDGSNPPVQNVVVGQPIILTTNPNLPASITPYKTTWTADGTNIGGFAVAPDSSSATVTPTGLKTASLNSFWVYQASNIPVTYQYCVNIPGVGKQCSQTANATFSVTGPTATITPGPTSWSVSPQISCSTIVQLLYFGYPDPTSGCSRKPLVKGISFTAALSNVPNGGGTAEWVQLVKGNRLSGTTLSGVPATPTSLGVGLDKSYPYPPDDPNDPVTTEASDSPNNGLDTSLARETRRFKANMYYLWKPQISGSIFVPLGYVEWSTSGTAAQKAKDTPPWSLVSSGPTTAVFNASSDTGNAHGFPTWSGIAMNVQSNGNENGDEGEELEEQQ